MYLLKLPVGCIGQLVHQQVIADQQRVFHGTGRNHEGLHQRGGAEQQEQDGDGPFGDGPARWLGLGYGRGRAGFGGGFCFSTIRGWVS